MNPKLATFLIACLPLVVCEFFLAGPNYFADLLTRSLVYVFGIAILAVLIRTQIRRPDILASILCGVIVGVVGFFVVLFVAVSGI